MALKKPEERRNFQNADMRKAGGINGDVLNYSFELLNNKFEIIRGKKTKFYSFSSDETKMAGRLLGFLIKSGETVYLYGGVGAGKTAFTAGLASALGVGDCVNSPTFTILNVYENKTMVMYHFDAYRIESPDELLETGFFDFIGGDCVVVMEWAERAGGYKPEKCVEVWIGRVKDCDNKREITINFNNAN